MAKKLFTDKFFKKYINSDGFFDMQRCLEENPNTREKKICTRCNDLDIPIFGYQKCPVCNFSKREKLDLGSHLAKNNDEPHDHIKDMIKQWVSVDNISRPEIEKRLGGFAIRGYLHDEGLWRTASESRPLSKDNLSCPVNSCTSLRNGTSENTLRAHLSTYSDVAHNRYRKINNYAQCHICSNWFKPGSGLMDHISQDPDETHQLYYLQHCAHKEKVRNTSYVGTENVNYVVCKIPGCNRRNIDLRQHVRFHHKMTPIEYKNQTGTPPAYIEDIMNRGLRDPSMGHRDVAKDGHKTYSWGELFLDDWLYDHKIEHDPQFRIGLGMKSADQALYIDGEIFYIEFDGMGRDSINGRWDWGGKLDFYQTLIAEGSISGYLIIRTEGIKGKDKKRALIERSMTGFMVAKDKKQYCEFQNSSRILATK